jgi:predicted permease
MFVKDLAYAVRTLRNSPVFAITAILGRRMLNRGAGGPLVVGVLAPRFELLFPPDGSIEQSPEIWTAARLAYDGANRNNVSLRVIGRLKNGVTLERAQAEADAFSAFERKQDAISATASFPAPLAGGFSPIRWGKEAALADASKYQAVDWQIVLPGYFDTFRTPLLAGRPFTEADNVPERNVVIIDQVLAAKAFPNESAVGKRILIRLRTPEPEWVEVIGVAAHQRQTSLAEPGREQIYFTDGFIGYGAAGRWAVRTAGDPSQYAGEIRAEIARIDPHLLITEMRPMQFYVEQAQAGTRFSLLLIGVFGGIAALLAGVGLYGVLSTVVRQRTSEIGVRMALGAAPAGVFNLVVAQGLRLSAAGVVIGLAAALSLTRVMASLLVGIQATDPPTFTAMAVLFLIIAAAASWLPARRAAGLDPTEALREE